MLIILSMPVFQLNVVRPPSMRAMGTYSVLSFLAFLIWKKDEHPLWHWFAIFSVLVGCIFAIKYTGVVVAMSFGALLCVTRPKAERWTAVISRLFVFGFVISLVMAPWLIRNVVLTGNPDLSDSWPNIFRAGGIITSPEDKTRGRTGQALCSHHHARLFGVSMEANHAGGQQF